MESNELIEVLSLHLRVVSISKGKQLLKMKSRMLPQEIINYSRIEATQQPTTTTITIILTTFSKVIPQSQTLLT